MQNINLSIPDDIIFEIRSLPSRERKISEKIQLRLAIGMFVSQEISLARAAQLAGQSISEFMDTLKGLSIPSFVYTEDMLYDDLKFANEA